MMTKFVLFLSCLVLTKAVRPQSSEETDSDTETCVPAAVYTVLAQANSDVEDEIDKGIAQEDEMERKTAEANELEKFAESQLEQVRAQQAQASAAKQKLVEANANKVNAWKAAAGDEQTWQGAVKIQATKEQELSNAQLAYAQKKQDMDKEIERLSKILKATTKDKGEKTAHLVKKRAIETFETLNFESASSTSKDANDKKAQAQKSLEEQERLLAQSSEELRTATEKAGEANAAFEKHNAELERLKSEKDKMSATANRLDALKKQINDLFATTDVVDNKMTEIRAQSPKDADSKFMNMPELKKILQVFNAFSKAQTLVRNEDPGVYMTLRETGALRQVTADAGQVLAQACDKVLWRAAMKSINEAKKAGTSVKSGGITEEQEKLDTKCGSGIWKNVKMEKTEIKDVMEKGERVSILRTGKVNKASWGKRGVVMQEETQQGLVTVQLDGEKKPVELPAEAVRWIASANKKKKTKDAADTCNCDC